MNCQKFQAKKYIGIPKINFDVVTPEGIEPPPREPESLVLSIKLRSQKMKLFVASTGIEPVFGV